MKNYEIPLDQVNKQKYMHSQSQKLLYWMGMLILVVSSFYMSLLLVPLMLLFDLAPLLFVVVLMGLFFGFIINYIVNNLEHLETKHHVFLGLITPLIAIANVFFVVTIAKRVGIALNMTIRHDPYLISMVYLVALILPYLLFKMGQHKLYKQTS